VTYTGDGNLQIAIALTNGNVVSGNQPPNADAGGPYYASVSDAIPFDGSRSSDTEGMIEGYRWDFTNDGTYDTEWLISATTTHSYASFGTYTVKLEVKDDTDGTDTDTTTVQITRVIPSAQTNGPYSEMVNQPITFSSSGSNGGSGGTIVSWDWTFGDGDVSSAQNPNHIYTTAGIFTVTLKVTNNYDEIDTDTTSVTISELLPVKMPPVANAGGPYSGVVGSEITFDGSGSNDSDGFITSYTWYFGSAITGTGVYPTHTYTTPGNYTIILVVTDNESLTHSNETTVRILPRPPTIVISPNVSSIDTIEEENEMGNITIEDNYQLKRAFLLGRVQNLIVEGNYITVDAVNLRIIFLNPFQFFHYSSGDTITFANQYHGRIYANNFLIGSFNVAV
jgi:PKD repeat protein